jgi:hypothetical protein
MKNASRNPAVVVTLAACCSLVLTLPSCTTETFDPGPIPPHQVVTAKNIPGYLKTVSISSKGINSKSRSLLEQALAKKGWEVVSTSDADVELVASLHENTLRPHIYEPSGTAHYVNFMIGYHEPLPPTPPTISTLTLVLEALDHGGDQQQTIWKSCIGGRGRYHSQQEGEDMLNSLEDELMTSALASMPARTFHAAFPTPNTYDSQ